MKAVLITGASGFVGKHLIKQFIQLNEYRIHTICRDDTALPVDTYDGIFKFYGDLRNPEFVNQVVSEIKPKYILHLAAESSVAYSWEEPNMSFQNNVNIYLNLLEAVRKVDQKTRIISIGSSEEYGIVKDSDIPINEDCRTNPISPYAVARQAQSSLSAVYVKGFGLDIVSTRSFNHFGSDQTDRFVIPAFIKKVLNQKYNLSDQKIRVGDLSIVRDFLHVEDVVDAYISLLAKGKSGEIYNVCYGEGFSLKYILDYIYEVAEVNSNYVISDELIRPNDNPVIIGNNQKILNTTGWKPNREFKSELCYMVKELESKYK
jgi:GDP-4-dehydro-6-deoxy-D-mannose reductase